MTEPTDLSIFPVVSRWSRASAPGPLTSRRFSGVMSYIATASRVRHASAAAIGEWNRADQASRAAASIGGQVGQQCGVGLVPVRPFPAGALQEDRAELLLARGGTG